jgi:hypothetical protein
MNKIPKGWEYNPDEYMELLRKYILYEKQIFEAGEDESGKPKRILKHPNIVEYFFGKEDATLHQDFWYYIVYGLLNDGCEL